MVSSLRLSGGGVADVLSAGLRIGYPGSLDSGGPLNERGLPAAEGIHTDRGGYPFGRLRERKGVDGNLA